MHLSTPVFVRAVDTLPCGLLLAVTAPLGLCVIHPATGKNKQVYGAMVSKACRYIGVKNHQHIVVVASQCCAYVSDPPSHRVLRVTLPAQWCLPATGTGIRSTLS
jgi:hypothetical protein